MGQGFKDALGGLCCGCIKAEGDEQTSEAGGLPHGTWRKGTAKGKSSAKQSMSAPQPEHCCQDQAVPAELETLSVSSLELPLLVSEPELCVFLQATFEQALFPDMATEGLHGLASVCCFQAVLIAILQAASCGQWSHTFLPFLQAEQ